MKTRMQRTLAALGIAALVTLSSPTTSQAQLVLGLDFEFSGATAPVGSTPWLTATFANNGANTVRLTMEASNLTASEYVSGWYFNLNPALNPTALTFAPVSTSDAVVSSISTGANAFKADGDGFFDIKFNFQNSAGAGRFTGGETLVYDISGISGLDFTHFNYFSVNGVPGTGNYLSAAHVQSINGEDSGWIGAREPGEPIPEPSTFVILGSFVAAAIYLKRRQGSKDAIVS